MMDEFKSSMKKEFSMTDLGKMKYFLGIEIIQGSERIYMCQRKYALEVLARFNMADCNSVTVPIVPGTKIDRDRDGEKVDETQYKQLIGSLVYIKATRPDLMYSVSLLSRFMSNPTHSHTLIGYTDSDYAGGVEDRKSTSGYVFLISNGAVAWTSIKQSIVTLSTTEAEFVAAGAAACQAIWMMKIVKELGLSNEECTDIYCDNSSAIRLSQNPILHGN